MKRFFFSLIALAAVATGCTQSAMLETPDLGTEISFSPYTGRTPESKATSIVGSDGLANVSSTAAADADPNGFYVYGYLNEDYANPYMNNVKVYSPNKDGNNWTYDSKVYWPDATSESTLSFVAYSANATGHIQWATDKSKFTYAVQDNMDAQIDLLATAYQEGLTIGNSVNGNITLYFHHLLSRIGFKVLTTSSKAVTIHSLSFNGNMHTQGELILRDAKGTAKPMLNGIEKEYKEYKFVDSPVTLPANTTAQAIKSNEYLMIIPHIIRQGDDHTIEVNYQIDGSNTTKTATVELDPDFEFKPGTSYEFILKISTSSIKFSVTETDWDETTSIEYPLEPSTKPDVAVSGALATDKSATVNLIVNKAGFAEVGVAYKKSGETSFSYAKASSTAINSYEVTLSSLASSTEYIYCAYSRATSGGDPTYYPATESECPKFKTKANVILNTIEAKDITESTVTLTGSCSGEMAEYGFCWAEGSSTSPSIGTDNSQTVTATSETFTGTISSLKPNTTYTFWAYVKDKDGDVSFSASQTKSTNFAVEDGDDTGAGWGEGGSTDFE